MAFAPPPRARTLTRRLAFTLLALFVYRVGCAWPVPGVDQDAFAAAAEGADIALLQALALLGGGAAGVLGLFLLGTGPAIVAALAEQLGARLLPALAAIKDQPGGADRLHAIARRLAALIALGQALGVVLVLRNQGLLVGQGPLDAAACVVSLTLGALLVMWLGEQIGERGIGQGLSVLISAGLLAQTAHHLPGILAEALEPQLLALVVLLGSVAVVAYVNGCRRVLALHYPRPALNPLTPAPRSRMPVPLNLGGVTPAIFAAALVGAPATLSGLFGAGGGLIDPTGVSYALIQGALVLGFTFAYAGVALDPVEYAERLRRSGAFVAGVRPGPQTVRFLGRLTNRLSLPGGLFLALVAAAPGLLVAWVPASAYLPAGTGVIIVVLTIAKARAQARAIRTLSAPPALLEAPPAARSIL